MTFSMTAFARCEQRDERGELVWELRSVNHRYLELFVRLPEELRSLEPLVREHVGKQLARGKVDCSLRFASAGVSDSALRVNTSLAKRLLRASEELETLLGTSARPKPWDLLRWPGVLEAEPQDLTPVQERATKLLDQALENLVGVRRREGERLSEIVGERCRALQVLVAQARERIPLVLDEVRERIRARLQEVAGELDPARVEQEMVLLAQRLDVDEEMERLGAHLDEVLRVLAKGGSKGRRLDFLMQELNREANTLASKSSDVEITRIGVEMKVLIEQMREQVQNIE
jgi:uncharacterized protein (TIGR00255 family)